MIRNLRAAVAALFLLVLSAAGAAAAPNGAVNCTGLAANWTSDKCPDLNEEITNLDRQGVHVLESVSGTDTITASGWPYNITAYTDGLTFRLKPANNNTGAVTINVDSVGAKAIVKSTGSALSSGDLQSSTVYVIQYFASDDHFRVLTAVSGGVGLTAADIDTSAEIRAIVSDETGTGALMFGLTTAMTDGLSCSGSQVVRRNAGDTAFECATVSGGAVADADYGDITVSSTGTLWNIDAGVVGPTEIATDGVSADELNATGVEAELEAVIELADLQGDLALGTKTSGNYAAGDAEAGAALTGDSATAFFSAGTIEDARIDGSAEADEVNPTLGTQTQGNYVATVADGTGIDGTSASEGGTFTPTLDLTEVSSATLGAGAFTALTFDAGAVDPVLTTGSGSVTWSGLATFNIDDEGEFRLFEEDAGGANYIGFKAPAAITSNVTCTLENDGNPIPDSCVGNGTDDGGALADADYGDVTVSGSGLVWDIDADTITTTELADNAVANANVADNAIAQAEMADNAIGNAEMADNAVANAEMADNAVTQAEVGDDAIGLNEIDLIDGNSPTTGDCLIARPSGVGGTVESTTCPGAGGGISNVVEDIDPELGGGLDLAGFDITGTGNISITGAVTASTNVTATAGDVTSGDDVIVGDDLTFATGAVVNWDASDVTITHSANTLTLAGGDLVVPTEVYDGTGWNGDLSVPTKDAIRDKIEAGIGLADADYGDFTVTGGVAAIDADSVALTTDTTGNYVGTVADGTGIDGTASAEGATYTPTLDLTELNTFTLGAGSATGIIFDAGATDPAIEVASGSITIDIGGTNELVLNATNLTPGVNDGNALGASGTAWADLFLASGGLIEFDGGTTNTFTCTGGNCTIEGNGLYRAGGTDVAIADGGTGASDAATAFSNLKQAATETATGVVELATTAEAETGTDTTRAVTPAGLAFKPESFCIALSDETTDLTTGTAKATWRMPYAFTVTAVRASVNDAAAGTLITVDINEAGTTIISTKLTIDIAELTSTTAATPAVISDASLADDAAMSADIDGVGTTAKGLKICLIGHQ